MVPQWDTSWGEEPFKDMNGNFLYSKMQLSILLFFDRLDGGILPYSKEDNSLTEFIQHSQAYQTQNHDRKIHKSSQYQNISEHKKYLYHLFLLELGVLAYPKDRKYIDLIYEIVYRVCSFKEYSETVQKTASNIRTQNSNQGGNRFDIFNSGNGNVHQNSE